MKINIITCHNVYNFGASLQAYALSHYLHRQGHEVQIIDYLPDYLRHYRLFGVTNPAYNKPFVRIAYQLAKLPGRIRARKSARKRAFDRFTEAFLPLTDKRFWDYKALEKEPPAADLTIAGSDQIWNPLFQNGKDPAYFLQFVKAGRKISYAASFSVPELPEEDKTRMEKWLKGLDAISVREASAMNVLRSLGLSGQMSCDPVFLFDAQYWASMAEKSTELELPEHYLLVYDFDGSSQVQDIALKIAKEKKLKIVSPFSVSFADKVITNIGPLEFLKLIYQADAVLSNSFHATAFSMIFHKDVFVSKRSEKINVRMTDLLETAGLKNRLIESPEAISGIKAIDWTETDARLTTLIEDSKNYLLMQIDQA